MGVELTKQIPARKYFTVIDQIPTQVQSGGFIEQVKLSFSLEKCNIHQQYELEIFDNTNDKMEFLFRLDKMFPDKNRKVDFKHSCIINYFFEVEQKLVINVITSKIKTKFQTTLGKILSSPNNSIQCQLPNSMELITISVGEAKEKYEEKRKQQNIHDETLPKKIEAMIFTFELTKNKDFNFKHKKRTVYYKILNQDNEILYQSENIAADGTFQPVEIPVCLLDSSFTIIFENFKHKALVEIKTDINDFLMFNNKQIPIVYKAKKIGGKAKYFGLIKNKSYKLYMEETALFSSIQRTGFKYSFLDFLLAGLQLKVTFAIDFTDSNNSPTSKYSYHYISNGYKNDYEKVMQRCGSILSNYNYDQSYSAYAFGCIPPGEKDVSYCYPLTCQHDKPEITSIENVIKIYRQFALRVKLSGPTNYSSVLQKVIEEIIKGNNSRVYQVLVILTDGIFEDINRTMEHLLIGSKLPLSVIIVGIGNEDFERMEMMDSSPLEYQGNISKRDHVHYISFKDYKFQEDESLFGKDALTDLPRQILQYYETYNINPESFHDD